MRMLPELESMYGDPFQLRGIYLVWRAVQSAQGIFYGLFAAIFILLIHFLLSASVFLLSFEEARYVVALQY